MGLAAIFGFRVPLNTHLKPNQGTFLFNLAIKLGLHSYPMLLSLAEIYIYGVFVFVASVIFARCFSTGHLRGPRGHLKEVECVFDSVIEECL